jgi:hypothetical protein
VVRTDASKDLINSLQVPIFSNSCTQRRRHRNSGAKQNTRPNINRDARTANVASTNLPAWRASQRYLETRVSISKVQETIYPPTPRLC